MAKGLKFTGFTRFVVALLIIIPGAYTLSVYINKGELTKENLLDFKGNLNNDKESVRDVDKDKPERKREESNTADFSKECEELAKENEELLEKLESRSRRIDNLYEEIDALKKDLKEKNE